jgi:hypothetical protein
MCDVLFVSSCVEQGWYGLQPLESAVLSFDFSAMPEGMVYDEHLRIAIYITPSRYACLPVRQYAYCCTTQLIARWYLIWCDCKRT